jgi:hypothetical protein
MSAEFADLQPDEELLSGNWADAAIGSVHDRVDQRILWLVTRRLALVATAEGGWRQLYRDPRDGRLWELSFPHGSLHGGGPRHLAVMSSEAARESYRLSASDAW